MPLQVSLHRFLKEDESITVMSFYSQKREHEHMMDKEFFERMARKDERAIAKIEALGAQVVAKRKRLQPLARQEAPEILSLGEAILAEEAAALNIAMEKEAAAMQEVLENERKLNEQHANIAARIADSDSAKQAVKQPLARHYPPRRMLSGFSPTVIETDEDELELDIE